MSQMNIFDYLREPISITKPIRLIELFAGYGSQAMALNSQPVGNAGGNSYLYNVGYRIRKLTPRECGRLMGVPDEDIDKMAAVNSNTQLYKQFGNSIVVDVMCAMFKNLNINQK